MKFSKEWEVSFQNRQIKVENWWDLLGRTEARLFIDGSCVDTTYKYSVLNRNPLLKGMTQSRQGVPMAIEVIMRSGLLGVKAKICANGVQIGGDRF